jgi:acetyl-CoA acetyltransferase
MTPHWHPQDHVAIAGLGMTPMVRTPTSSPLELAADAVRRAVDDAGLRLADVDGLLVNPAAPNVPGMFLQQILGLRDLRMLANVQQFGSSAGAMVQYASLAVASGMASTVACVFTDAPITDEVMRYAQLRDITGMPSYEQAVGIIGANPRYALAARRHMLTYGTTTEQFGAVAVAQRKWAAHNPLALARQPMTLEDHASSRWIVEPFRLFDICFVCNGAIAVIVTSLDRARSLRKPPVHVWGWGQAHPGMTMERGSRFGLGSGAVESGRHAFEMAGIGVRDVTLCQIYDCYTFTVIVTLEDYGFCEKGEGGPFAASGALEPGGSLPTNTGGGQLSGYYMWGMTPLSEAIIQARGEGGGRQAPNTDVILVSGNGGVLDFHSTLVLSSKERNR